ncbi:beta-defensin 128 [Marmota monax]|uniref:beta-defensin 128 n=1 Tax=Marmota monax TaxID=9995 RepID=UPI001EAFA586|nr:beta-defensin 128 [Marmota monax]
MKRFLVLIVLLCELLKDSMRPKKCFSNVTGFCRKRCKLGETSDKGCLRGKFCCVNQEENKKYKKAPEVPDQPFTQNEKDKVEELVILPTVTLITIIL